MTTWSFILGVPLLALGLVAVLATERAARLLLSSAVAASVALWLAGAHGASVDREEARLAVETWLAEGDALGCELGVVAGEATAYSGADGVGSFYVVPLAKSDGTQGGFVVTSADTMLSPVLAFSDEGEFVASEENPLWLLLSGDVANSAGAVAAGASSAKPRLMASNAAGASSAMSGNENAWARLLGRREPTGGKFFLAASAPSDIRVGRLLTSAWNQEGSSGGYCYNYYTPNHYPCGCVATAFAQLLYYFRQPAGAVTTRWNCSGATDWEGGTWSLAQGSTLGPWEWDKMADNPTSESQRKAVGRLTWDAGRLCCMNYGPSSGASLLTVRRRLSEEIGYASSQAYHNDAGVEVAVLKRAVIPSLEAGLPVLLTVSNSEGGHAIVGDGYGYSGGGFYMHINMGWGSSYNTWYQPPNICEFTTLSQVVYNVYPSAPSGVAYGTIVSGRVFDAGGTVASGKTVTARRTSDGAAFTASSNANGIYALRLPADADYTISAESGGAFGTRAVHVGHCVSVYIKADGAFVTNNGMGWSDWQTGQGEANSVANEYDVDLTLMPTPAVAAPVLSPVSALSGGTFLSRRFTFTLGCDTSGATIRYTLDGSDPTEASPAYTGAIEIEGAVGVPRTVKAQAFLDGYRPSEVLSMTFVRAQPERWIDERPETHEGTGWWWPERTDFAVDGRLHLDGDFYYHANEPSAERCVTIDTTMAFNAADEADNLRPDADAKAAVRIGPGGGFQLFTLLGGQAGWVDVSANGVAAVEKREYTFRLRLDCINRIYSAAVVGEGGVETPLMAGNRSRFHFANGRRGSVGEVSFSGVGQVGAIIGVCSGDEIKSPDGHAILLK